MNRRAIWVVSLLLIAVVVYLFLSGVEKEMSRIEIIPDEEMFQPLMSGDLSDDPAQWKFDDATAFFVEYRLERDRVRSQEIEMLNEMIDNPRVGPEARLEAEQQLLQAVEQMEKELIVESMLKAQGYKDALLFSLRRGTTVMIEAEKLAADDYLSIAEMVAASLEVPREEVRIIQHSHF